MSTLGTEEVYQEIFDYTKTQLTNVLLDPYGAKLFPEEGMTDFVPNIVMRQIDYSLNSESLSHDQQRFGLALEVNIYARDINSTVNIPRRTIVNSLSDLMFDFLFNHFGLNITGRDPIPNLDKTVYRMLMRFDGEIDENKVIYR